MCIDDDTEESDEVRPSGILFLDPRTGDVATKRYNAMTKRKHLCLEIDGSVHILLAESYINFWLLVFEKARESNLFIVSYSNSEELRVSNMVMIQQGLVYLPCRNKALKWHD